MANQNQQLNLGIGSRVAFAFHCFEKQLPTIDVKCRSHCVAQEKCKDGADKIHFIFKPKQRRAENFVLQTSCLKHCA
jgi:hypothetical protein